VRYKSAILGFLWAVIVPMAMMAVFYFIFYKLFNYRELTPVYLLSALFPWMFVNQTLSQSVTAYIDNANIIKKVYFPREIIPLSIMLANLFNFILSVILLLIIAFLSGYPISINLLLLPLPILSVILLASGVALLSSAVHVLFRDIKYFVEIFLIVWFYFTPIFYDQKLIRQFSEYAFKIFLLNPMTGIIVMLRDIILYGSFSSIKMTIFTIFLCVLIYFIGLTVNLKLNKNFADYV